MICLYPIITRGWQKALGVPNLKGEPLEVYFIKEKKEGMEVH